MQNTNDPLPIKADSIVVINQELLKQVLFKVDPYNVNLLLCQEIIQTFKNQEAYQNLTNGHKIKHGVQLLYNFIKNVCQISIGKQIYKYNAANLNKYLAHKKNQNNQGFFGYTTNDINNKTLINSKQLLEMPTDFQNQSNPPVVTVNYKSSPTNTDQALQQFPNQTFTSTFMERRKLMSNLKFQGGRSQTQQKTFGTFLKPKHLILTDLKVLQPTSKIPPSIPIFNLHETLPKNILRQHFDEVEIPDIDLYNYNESTLAKFLKDREPAPQITQKFSLDEIKAKLNSLPETNDDVLNFVTSTDPNTLPTKALIKLAQKMKQRREEVYDYNAMQEASNKRKAVVSQRRSMKLNEGGILGSLRK